ncbi:MAG: hypothetical protein ACE5OW_03650 [Candidatus Bathyarchaeia archaeon]
MTYSTKAGLKPILDIDASDTTYDTELDECLTTAYGFVNSFYKSHGFSVPFSSPHQNVKDMERYLAAWLFRRRRAPPSEADVLLDMAMRFADAYIQAEKEGTLKRV